MLRFRIVLVAYSTRLILPIVISVLAICGAVYLAAIPLDFSDRVARQVAACENANTLMYCPPYHASRFAWQIPLAVLIGVVGLGSAGVLAFWNRRHPWPRPLPPLPAGWQ